MVQTLPMDEPERRVNVGFTCRICGTPGMTSESADPRFIRVRQVEHAGCRNLAGYIKSALCADATGQDTADIRTMIRDLWADSTEPYVSEFEHELARAFLADPGSAETCGECGLPIPACAGNPVNMFHAVWCGQHPNYAGTGQAS
jgi:hypothetical protein